MKSGLLQQRAGDRGGSKCVHRPAGEHAGNTERGERLGRRVPGPDPQGRSYQTYAWFSDPDGNGWLLQEIETRLPGREWED